MTDIIIQKYKMSNNTQTQINQSQFDENLKSMYFEFREQAYRNPNILDIEHGLLFRHVRISLIVESPNSSIHSDRLYDLQTLYYNGGFRHLYNSLGLDLDTGYGNRMKSKDQIILELYFHR